VSLCIINKSMSQTFIRTKENFICEHCSTHVSGNGYTNHCPVCLRSKHVDVYPGDRASSCGGIMQPYELVVVESERIIVHICERCGHSKRNRTYNMDNEDVLIALSAHVLI
jgi:rubrerythrin